MDLNEKQVPVPEKKLSVADSVLIIVGIVIGAGIFGIPPLVAANTADDTAFFTVWILGGLVSLIGALCYAELCTAFPNTGGDYHFLLRAYGRKISFLFAWARMSIIQTGSIAILAYIFGDYLSAIYNLGEFSSFVYASGIVILLTGINIAGISFGTGAQRLFTIAEIAGVLLVILVGFFFMPESSSTAIVASSDSTGQSLGLAMVFVLLTFGGWNEAAYITAEIKTGSKGMVRSLIISIIIITLLYLLINAAFIRMLGHSGLANSSAAGADVMNSAFGVNGTWIIGIIVAIAALTSANATIFTGARTNYALGKDFRIFSFLGKWNKKAAGPVNAFLFQGLIALALISMGLFTRSGFESIVEYTAPVFWLFFLLTGIALFVLRVKEPDIKRPFRVPLYPILPLIFCLSSAWLLYSSLAHTGLGALTGLYVLIAGIIILFFVKEVNYKSQANVQPKTSIVKNINN